MPIIIAIQEANIGGLQSKATLDKKLARPYFKNKPGMVVYTWGSSHLGGSGRTIVI
jgi:hypothetical protein